MSQSKITLFVAELVGTFGLLVAATGSIVVDGSTNFSLGPVFVAGVHFIGLFILVFIFGKYSMAHFNPAITIGFTLSGYLNPRLIPLYFAAQAIGAISGSLFVKYAIGNFAKLGLNAPNFEYSLPVIFGIEILATMFLMGGILLILKIKNVHTGIVSTVVGGIIALDVFFLGPISGASMNPIRSFAPALTTGIFDDLWLYLTAPFIGSAIVALLHGRKSMPKK
ncbi:MAG: MIP/aquaporin family protein [Nitrosopumilus sp.]